MTEERDFSLKRILFGKIKRKLGWGRNYGLRENIGGLHQSQKKKIMRKK